MSTTRDDAPLIPEILTTRALPEPASSVRLDKWLMVARVYKTRSLATKACELNRIEVNGQRAKPSRHLQVGDRVEAEIAKDWKRVLVVKELRDKPIAKSEVPRLFEDLSPPKPELDPIERIMRRTAAVRDPGAGRPTKKERRELERWRDP
jgi:ribosome-associated heat shock protein Hsp15